MCVDYCQINLLVESRVTETLLEMLIHVGNIFTIGDNHYYCNVLPLTFNNHPRPSFDPSLTSHDPPLTSHDLTLTSHDLPGFFQLWSLSFLLFFLKISVLEMLIAFGNEYLKITRLGRG